MYTYKPNEYETQIQTHKAQVIESLANDPRHGTWYQNFPWVLGVEGDFRARTSMVKEFSWAIPNEEAIKLLAQQPLVEIGAGNGYWAACIDKAGGDILCFDQEPWKHLHYPVAPGDARKAGDHPDRALFLCWPPYATGMAYQALKAYHEFGGSCVFYAGEGAGGCTGDDQFHEFLEANFQEVQVVRIPQWETIHDNLTAYTRK